MSPASRTSTNDVIVSTTTPPSSKRSRETESEMSTKKLKTKIQLLESRVRLHKQLFSISLQTCSRLFSEEASFSVSCGAVSLYRDNLIELLPEKWIGEKVIDGLFVALRDTYAPSSDCLVFTFSDYSACNTLPNSFTQRMTEKFSHRGPPATIICPALIPVGKSTQPNHWVLLVADAKVEELGKIKEQLVKESSLFYFPFRLSSLRIISPRIVV